MNLIMKAGLSAKFVLSKLVFIHMQTKLIFKCKAFALSQAFIMRFTATGKWPICMNPFIQYQSRPRTRLELVRVESRMVARTISCEPISSFVFV